MNTLPIEQFLDKARVAIKSNQKNVTFDIKEIQALSDSLAVVMTRVAGNLDTQLYAMLTTTSTPQSVNMDGGGFS